MSYPAWAEGLGKYDKLISYISQNAQHWIEWELFFFFFLCCFFFHSVSAKFHLWPSSGDLPRPRIGMLSLVTVSPVITAFHSCLSHHVFDQVNLWLTWVGFETAILPMAQRIEALSLYGSRWALSEDRGFKSYPSRPEVYLVKNMVR